MSKLKIAVIALLILTITLSLFLVSCDDNTGNPATTTNENEITTTPETEHIHTYTDTVIPSTCTEDGYTLHTCECGDTYKDNIVAALGHNWNQGVITTEPSCTVKGVRTYTCMVCGETKTEEILALGHTWDEGVVTKEPTCTEPGIRTYTCTVCNDTKTENIPAMGHSYATDWTVDVEPTCTTAGSKSHHCTICGDKTDITEITALGHTWDEGVVTKEPTCTEPGIRTYTCTVCNDTKTENIPATGHDYVDTYHEAIGDSKAYVTYVCNNCGNTYDIEIQPIQIVINETGYSSFNSYKKSVSFSISATGGYGNLLYKYEVFSSGTSSTPISSVTVDFCSQTTYGFQSAITVNNMVLQVTVKDSYGNIEKSRWTIMPAY